MGHDKEDVIAWLEKNGEQPSSQSNERAWLHLVSDVLTWKDGIGQYLDDPRVQELAKQLSIEYTQKLCNSVQNVPNGQKPVEWSEEDERSYQIVIDILDRENHSGKLTTTDLIACVRKLKSLRSQAV